MNRKKALEAYKKQLFLSGERDWRRAASECAEPAMVGLLLLAVLLCSWSMVEVIAWLYS